MTTNEQTPWGRVDETGTVFVREGESERAVGQYPDGTPEEALAYFERKYSDLAGQVTLLEQRVKNGAGASDVAKGVAALTKAVAEANAVGDLASLRTRVDALGGTVSELTEKQNEETKAALEVALAEREALVVDAERIAALDPARVQWKQITAEMDALFTRWKTHQTEGPRLPKSKADELWKRFRTARTTVDTHRRAFFAELDSAHKEVRSAKQKLIERAEALEPQGAAGIPAYRGLLDEWKAAGRAGKKLDDSLWAKFKAAGDVLYGAKAEVDAAENVEFEENFRLKEALLDEAEPIAKMTDREKAKNALFSVQKRWDEIGKVPRDKIRVVEDRMRRIETAVRKLDEDHWNNSNPEKQQREKGFLGQLNEAIAKLERELADAEAGGDQRAIRAAREALEARKAWLGAVAR